ncbi:MAG: aconitate hydratase AcnA, partial [Anaerolineaceae bacterium]|nr:aconitate hydratase AcnA [Anaerolineaceae bacterium]
MSEILNVQTIITVDNKPYHVYALNRCPGVTKEQLMALPYAIRILLEGAIRNHLLGKVSAEEIAALSNWSPTARTDSTVSFFPGRVLLQDFSGVPVLNDLAGLRAAVAQRGGNPQSVNPVIPVDLVIDHSVQVDFFGTPKAFLQNTELELERNKERYAFLHWCQAAFNNLRVLPPSSGIVHQVNLEYLSRVVLEKEDKEGTLLYPDTVVGTDSHTTMVNGLGVLGWGVGGIEAVGAMLGEPVEFLIPEVVGLRLTGKLPEGATPTDLTLAVTQLLRQNNVVEKFIEVFGPGLSTLDLSDRAMVANMAPEGGATTIYFPVDSRTLDYLMLTRGDRHLANLVEAYYETQGLFWKPNLPEPRYSSILELDMSTIEASLAGPKRPQDRIPLSTVKESFQRTLQAPKNQNGYGLNPSETGKNVEINLSGRTSRLTHGAVVIASITSCTNTSNPYVMVAAGLLAKKAVERGLTVPPYVKTSFAPGSRVVTEYLQQAGLMAPLEQLGFHLVGYGCTTCIGNSGPLPEEITNAVSREELVVAAVLSGNRNFEGRVSPQTRANYLASPPLVIAYALAGNVNLDLLNEPVGKGKDGKPVFLRDLWPLSQEINSVIQTIIQPEMYQKNYTRIWEGNAYWDHLVSPDTGLYAWDPNSTYLQQPPFFQEEEKKTLAIANARILARVGDSITTDHISPAGTIAASSPAGQYLLALGVPAKDFNSYGSRRGNDQVMVRGTLANIRLKNMLTPGVEGGMTVHFPTNQIMSIYDAAVKYQQEQTPLIILAGKEYGTGSSRDWAAKGVLLLGVKAILAESFERIHRSNLAGMGVLPLQFLDGQSAA